MRIVSWNVNGLRACARKGFLDFLEASRADVVGIQEVRAFEHQLDVGVRAPAGWHAAFAPAERAGYSGVAIYSRKRPARVETALGEPRFDVEGRLVIAWFGRLAVASVYFPKGSGRDRDNRRVPYKLDFYAAVFERLEAIRREGPVVVVGDYNTAHEPIDLARPASNTRTSGFLSEERAELTRWLDAGWVDTFRARHPGEARALHVVAAVGRGARAERRLAHRLRARLAGRGGPGPRRVHLARGDGLRPLSRGRRPGAATAEEARLRPAAPRKGVRPRDRRPRARGDRIRGVGAGGACVCGGAGVRCRRRPFPRRRRASVRRAPASVRESSST